MKKNQESNPETLRNFAIQEAEKIKKSLRDKGTDEKTINESIATFMKSIEDTIKNQENERN
jgi:hypothetical protein